jgi:modification methylase
VHGQVRTTRDSGRPNVENFDHRHSRDPGNLAHRSLDDLMTGFTEILIGCHKLLKPGGFLAITARPIRRHGALVDIPTIALAAAIDAGLTPWERCVALLARVSDVGLTARASFFQLVNTANARKNGLPMHVPAHEEVLVLVSR